MTTYFGTTFHGMPGLDHGHPDQRRNSTLHVDTRQFAQEVRAWLDAHPDATPSSLSMAAGVSSGYVSSVLRESTLELDARCVGKVRRAMRGHDEGGI